MRTLPELPRYRLTFLVPRSIARVAQKRWRVLLIDGCTANLDGNLCVITSTSRERSFEQAAKILRARGEGESPQSIQAVLRTPVLSGRDSWQIILTGTEIVCVPTSLPPYFPAIDHGPAERPPPGGFMTL